MDVTIRHHALESGCFVINSTGWLTNAQINAMTTDPALQKGLRGGCNTAIISPEGVHLAPPLREGEGMVIADLDMKLITKRKRMMDSVGHYARPELLSLAINDVPASHATSMHTNSLQSMTHRSNTHEHKHPVTESTTIGNHTTTDDGASVLRVAAG